MEIVEIKEFIEQEISFREEELEHHEIKIDTKDHINSLDHILYMLDELEDKADNTTEWIKLTTHGMIRFQCKKCDSIFSLPWEHCPKCGREVTNNIKSKVHKYNYETGKLEEVKEDK